MKNRKERRGKLLLAVLAVALIAAIAVIIWKQMEYGASEQFYDSLRGALTGRWSA